MKTLLTLLSVFVLSALMVAQTHIATGTVIPVELNSTINAKNCKAGQIVKARVAQDVQLENGNRIKAGTRVMGEILAVTPTDGSHPAMVALRFNKIEISGRSTLIVSNLRALASPLEVDAAQTQVSGDDRGSTPPWSQTLTLIGGDVAYREEGHVDSGEHTVGEAVYAGNWGVLSRVSTNPDDAKCRGAVQGNDTPQALWVFSHDACGVYGSDVIISHAGRTNPEGKIVLTSTSGDLKIRSGSAMLLRVDGIDDTLSRNEVVSK